VLKEIEGKSKRVSEEQLIDWLTGFCGGQGIALNVQVCCNKCNYSLGNSWIFKQQSHRPIDRNNVE